MKGVQQCPLISKKKGMDQENLRKTRYVNRNRKDTKREYRDIGCVKGGRVRIRWPMKIPGTKLTRPLLLSFIQLQLDDLIFNRAFAKNNSMSQNWRDKRSNTGDTVYFW